MDLFEQEINRLSILIDVSKTCFALAVYNEPTMPQEITKRLKANLKLDIDECYVTTIIKNPLRLLIDKNISPQEHHTVCFYDIEKGLPELLGYINLNRDELAGYNSSLIFWVTEDTYKQLSVKSPDFFSRHSGRFDFTIPVKKEFGILGLIDLVNFSPQSNDMGSEYSQKFLNYYYAQARQIVEDYGFEYIKDIGDAVLFFGKIDKTEDFIKIILALFQEKRIKDSFGFKVSLRMVSHCGFFNFWLDKYGKKVDVAGSEAIRTFRLEKEARAEEIIVTRILFEGLQSHLKDYSIESFQETQPRLLKGFSQEPVFIHRLISPKNIEEKSVNLLDWRLQELKDRSQKIPVLAGLYEPVDIEKNFIDLTIAPEKIPQTHGFHRKMVSPDGWGLKEERGNRQTEWDEGYREPIEKTKFTAKEIFEEFNKGFIYGSPGAGKTTILHYFVHQTFKIQGVMPVFVKCMHLPDFEVWSEKKGYNPKTVRNDVKQCLEYLFYGFLFPGKEKSPQALSPDELIALQMAEQEMLTAWSKSRLSVYVDGLDEAAFEARQIIVDIVKAVMNASNPNKKSEDVNRIFLTSRYSDRERYDEGKEHVLHVAQLDMEQLRQLARVFYHPESDLYKEFDDIVWRDEVVQKVAGTPLTGLLVMVYYEVFHRIDRRYQMYDLLLKFFLLRVWNLIKEKAEGDISWQFRGLKEFFIEAKKEGFLKTHPDIAKQYDCLSTLAYECLYRSASEEPLRSIPIRTIYEYIKNQGIECVDEWLAGFRQEQLLVTAGYEEYTIVHSSVMEFLAARRIVHIGFDSQIKQIVNQDIKSQLETLIIAASSPLDTGYKIIHSIKQGFKDEDFLQNKPLVILSYRCLCEVEAMEKAELQLLGLQIQQEQKLDELKQKRPEWLYLRLAEIVLLKDLKGLESGVKDYEKILTGLPLTSLLEYLPQNDFFDAFENQRLKLLKCMMGKDKEIEQEINNWVDKWYIEKFGGHRSLLRLDIKEYHPDDKNFNYYQKNVSHLLQGFLGSPNMRHDSGILGCAFSSDGRYLLSASSDNSLRLWDSDTGKEMRQFTGHTGWVNGCAFSNDGRLILSASSDHTLRLWDSDTGRQIRQFTGHTGGVNSCAFSNDGRLILSASNDRTLRLWDSDTGRQIRQFTGHTKWINSCAFSNDSRLILSASSDHTLRLWDSDTGRQIRQFTGHTGGVKSCAFSNDGRLILSASSDKTLRLWDSDTGRQIRQFAGHTIGVKSCAFSNDGRLILSASSDKTLRLWDRDTGEEIRQFTGHTGWINSCAFLNDDRLILSVSGDGTLRLWDRDTGRQIRQFAGHTDWVNSCAFSNDGRLILSASSDNTLRLWDRATGKEMQKFTGHTGWINGCAFSNDGRLILSASRDNTLRLWDRATGRQIRQFTGHTGGVKSCAFSNDGRLILSASGDGMRVWDRDTGRQIRQFAGHTDWVNSCAFSNDGRLILSAFWDNMRLWDRDTGEKIRQFTGHTKWINSCAFSNDGRLILSASSDKTLRLWDRDTGEELRRFIGHTGGVNGCAFSNDGRHIISVSTDRTLRVWDKESGDEVFRIDLLWTPQAISLSPNPDDEWVLVTANRNATLTIFDLKERQEIR